MRKTVVLTGLALSLGVGSAMAQNLTIPDDLRKTIVEWGSDPANVREGGSYPEDWRFEMPEGITSKRVTYWSGGVACGATVFYPKDFKATGSYPGVVIGHGTNGVAIGIDKYGARFAEYGLVSMVIDYRGYGISNGYVMVQSKDNTPDTQSSAKGIALVKVKRTRLLTVKHTEDFRNAISWIQGEPGVNPDKIGIWGSSLGGGTVQAVAGLDGRVKAVVAQVAGATAPARRGPNSPNVADSILRARQSQGGEFVSGFSFKTNVDTETNYRQAENQGSYYMMGMDKKVPILYVAAENDELGSTGAVVTRSAARNKELGYVNEVVVIPSVGHFQPYVSPPWEASSRVAAEWLAHYLK